MGAVGRGAAPTLDVLFFDVGQGDAVLISTPGDKHVLVDTGPRSFGGGSAATHTVLPYLSQHGITHLEAVVVSHPDGDHLGGLPSILKEMSVGRFLHSGQEVDTDLYKRSRKMLKEEKIPSRAVDRGDALKIGALRMEVLGPPAFPSKRGIESENGKSVVLRLAYGRTEILLPGDVEKSAEGDLVRTYGKQLRSEIVKVPHHGSATSSTQPFVRATVDSLRETMAVISVGRTNQFGMPDKDVVERWESLSSVQSTACAGAVWMRTDGKDVWQISWR